MFVSFSWSSLWFLYRHYRRIRPRALHLSDCLNFRRHLSGELRTELDRAHQDAEQARGALAEQQKATAAAAAQLDQVREELAGVRAKADAEREAHQEQKKAAAAEAHRVAERLTAAQGERDQARKEAGQAREEAARLAGQLTAHQEQNAALLARIQPAADQDKPAKGRK